MERQYTKSAPIPVAAAMHANPNQGIRRLRRYRTTVMISGMDRLRTIGDLY
jgi:hypothetical protein